MAAISLNALTRTGLADPPAERYRPGRRFTGICVITVPTHLFGALNRTIPQQMSRVLKPKALGSPCRGSVPGPEPAVGLRRSMLVEGTLTPMDATRVMMNGGGHGDLPTRSNSCDESIKKRLVPPSR
jgi:hypothetical protein